MPSLIQQTGVGPPTFASSSSSNGILGKDDFLKLLVQQLRFQDPLDPLKGTEFAAQLAQFSSVEQLSNISGTLSQSIDANYVLTQSINNALSATLIGKDVKASGEAFSYSGEGEVKLGYNLASSANTIDVKIYDENGNLVRTVTGTGTGKGDNTFAWDGKNDRNETVPAGKYTFSVEAKDSNGASITTSRFIFGTVTGVRYKPEGTVFVVDGQEIPLSDILEIMQG